MILPRTRALHGKNDLEETQMTTIVMQIHQILIFEEI